MSMARVGPQWLRKNKRSRTAHLILTVMNRGPGLVTWHRLQQSLCGKIEVYDVDQETRATGEMHGPFPVHEVVDDFVAAPRSAPRCRACLGMLRRMSR